MAPANGGESESAEPRENRCRSRYHPPSAKTKRNATNYAGHADLVKKMGLI
ncbi:hypothetical protein FTUN_4357 [Frigoriglobus tundricola]|uniref:Uncharacterized protein n=1 Tax=Frigoriglobus tundricola TaxID=2774151 RepID=A0A6M5YS16_9BACT|nr:hypothetical protein FTUN_4357 [Frigoriglobus tundricola]